MDRKAASNEISAIMEQVGMIQGRLAAIEINGATEEETETLGEVDSAIDDLMGNLQSLTESLSKEAEEDETPDASEEGEASS